MFSVVSMVILFKLIGWSGGGEGDGVDRGGIVKPELMRVLHGKRAWGFL